jgi:xanthine dehydrogenase accessory factor
MLHSHSMSPETLDLMQAFVEAVNRNEAVALITVVRSQTPGLPPPSSRMVVWDEGRVLGSFGKEWDDAVLTDARTSLAGGFSQAFIYPKTGARTRRAEQSASFEVYVEVVRPPTLLVVGGGHVGAFVAKLGKLVGFQVAVLDDRPEFANRERFPDADQIICEDFIPALERFPITDSTFVVVVTRGHKQDEISVRTVVNSDAAYIGMIGSKRRASAVMKLLADSGVPRDLLDRVHSPIGLDIHAETPEEIAVSIIAEIIMTRLGGTGAPLSTVVPLTY